MGNIYLLDCTLRDGGYVNNWRFGGEAIQNIKRGLEQAGADIIELGFFRNEAANPDRSVFSNGTDIRRRFHGENRKTIYSAMIEPKEPEQSYSPELLGTPMESGIDLIRICTWKRLTKEHLAYCRTVADMGYRVSIQPTAVGQYTTAEFAELLKRANEIHPFSFYIVDTWGTQSPAEICTYLELAERYLNREVKVGYHGHNNKMQALGCAQAAIAMGLSHDLCLDASIMGMGRGAGNLQMEVLMDHLNEATGGKYDPLILVDLYARHLRKFFEAAPWGYSLYHYLSAQYNCSQDFATYFKEKNYGEETFQKFLEGLSASEKIVFRAAFVEERLKEMGLS